MLAGNLIGFIPDSVSCAEAPNGRSPVWKIRSAETLANIFFLDLPIGLPLLEQTTVLRLVCVSLICEFAE